MSVSDTFTVPAQGKFYVAGEEVSENVYNRVQKVRLAAEEVCRIADTHTTGEVQRGVHDPALNVAIQHLYKVLNREPAT